MIQLNKTYISSETGNKYTFLTIDRITNGDITGTCDKVYPNGLSFPNSFVEKIPIKNLSLLEELTSQTYEIF